MKKLKISSIIVMILVLLIPLTIKAEEVNEKYNGEYSIDYLLRNYNVVTFGMNENVHFNGVAYNFNIEPGSINVLVEGPTIINGNYIIGNEEATEYEYSTKNPTNVTSYIAGTTEENIFTQSKTSTNENFIDFEKLYKQVLAESNALLSKTQYYINSKNIEIDKPGIYQINSTRFNSQEYKNYSEAYLQAYDLALGTTFTSKYIYIDNYDPNSYYIFNNTKLFEYDNYIVQLKKKGESDFQLLEDYEKTGEYTGNIIFNYPDAKMISSTANSGKIIAPKADVIVSTTTIEIAYGDYFEQDIQFKDSIFANSIIGQFSERYRTSTPEISFAQYKSEAKITLNAKEVIEYTDYTDDLYVGSYSIEEMLKNYNLVTLGLKEYEDNTTFAQIYNYNYNYPTGDVNLFHITGQFLINGKLRAYRLDLEANRRYESTYQDIITDGYNSEETRTYSYKRWGDGDSNIGTNSNVYITNRYGTYFDDRLVGDSTPFMNFERLYDQITTEQEKIEKGTKVSSEGGIAHIKVGGNYYIENINELDEIVFDNFEDNENKLTVITILNTDDLYFPRLSQTATGNYVPTKDYYGKEEARFEYEYYNFPDDIYHGNIIWNVPNATYIELAPYAPFFGHLVAPNADLETPETHFSGSFIVNSLYAEGNSEAHFFPLQAVNVPKDYNSTNPEIKFAHLGYGVIKQDEVPTEPEISNPVTSVGTTLIIIFVIALANVWIIKHRNVPKEEAQIGD